VLPFVLILAVVSPFTITTVAQQLSNCVLLTRLHRSNLCQQTRVKDEACRMCSFCLAAWLSFQVIRSIARVPSWLRSAAQHEAVPCSRSALSVEECAWNSITLTIKLIVTSPIQEIRSARSRACRRSLCPGGSAWNKESANSLSSLRVVSAGVGGERR
jgi:hypothetical protein